MCNIRFAFSVWTDHVVMLDTRRRRPFGSAATNNYAIVAYEFGGRRYMSIGATCLCSVARSFNCLTSQLFWSVERADANAYSWSRHQFEHEPSRERNEESTWEKERGGEGETENKREMRRGGRGKGERGQAATSTSDIWACAQFVITPAVSLTVHFSIQPFNPYPWIYCMVADALVQLFNMLLAGFTCTWLVNRIDRWQQHR